jgi:formiminotetrahydrofolate cyclodeaminase
MNEPFFIALASPEPSPGGGAAAAYAACLGVALLKKVIHLELLRSRTSRELTSLWKDLLRQANEMEASLEKLIEEDGEVYLEFVKARTECGRTDFADALERAIECPIKIMVQSNEGLELTEEVAKRCARHLLSDLLVSGESFLAAVSGASHIAWANVCLLPGSTPHELPVSAGEISTLEKICREKHLVVQAHLKARIKGDVSI